MWNSAEILFDGTVRFDPTEQTRAFQVIRENVLRIWNLTEAKAGVPTHKQIQRQAPVKTRVRNAINELWPNGIPNTLRAKERDSKIALHITKQQGHKTSADAALARAVQRVLQRYI
jgi:hypothetical protein